MRTLWKVLVAALLVVAAANAEPLVVKTFPPGARVLIADRQYVGLTGQPLRDLGSGTYSLTLRLDEHEPLTVTISGNDFANGVYPAQGQLYLNYCALTRQ